MINCVTLPENLLESELPVMKTEPLPVLKGGKPKFELPDRLVSRTMWGCQRMQTKPLGLQERVIERVGGTKPIGSQCSGNRGDQPQLEEMGPRILGTFITPNGCGCTYPRCVTY